MSASASPRPNTRPADPSAAARGRADTASPAENEAPAAPAERELIFRSLPGRTPYAEGLELQRRLAREKIDGRRAEDWLLLVEHEPVLTLGRTADPGHLRASRKLLEARGIACVEIERGGDVTYHGPGQLVGYPILDLRAFRRDLHWYVRTLEEALIRALAGLDLPAFRISGHTGVWVGDRGAAAGPAPNGEAAGPRTGGCRSHGDRDENAREGGERRAEVAIASGRVRKIASIGVHVSRWVTWHGFALNVTREPLDNFDLIVPCGIRNVRMTSLEDRGIAVKGADDERLRDAVARGFGEAFGVRPRRTHPPGHRGASAVGTSGRGGPT